MAFNHEVWDRPPLGSPGKMKYFLFSLLFLTGCVTYQVNTLPHAPGPTSIGFVDNMEWSCEETDVNDALVWVRCEFHNGNPPSPEVCIQVTFNDNMTRQEVIESRRMCSGPLWAGGSYENHAAFFKEKRIALTQACGPKLENCFMTTKIVKND